MSYDQIQAIAACVKTTCQDDCHMRADMDQWPDSMCDATPMPQPIADAGPADASGPPKTAPKGCGGCATAPADVPPAAWAAVLALLLIPLVRRRARW